VESAAEMLHRLLSSWPEEAELRREPKLLEEKGDRITHDVIHELHSTAVTPLDREDSAHILEGIAVKQS
jgi:uncharacterized protein